MSMCIYIYILQYIYIYIWEWYIYIRIYDFMFVQYIYTYIYIYIGLRDLKQLTRFHNSLQSTPNWIWSIESEVFYTIVWEYFTNTMDLSYWHCCNQTLVLKPSFDHSFDKSSNVFLTYRTESMWFPCKGRTSLPLLQSALFDAPKSSKIWLKSGWSNFTQLEVSNSLDQVLLEMCHTFLTCGD